jgi:hypothetical protein
MAVSSVRAKDTPEAQLLSLIEKFDPKDQRLIRSVRSAVRKRLPTANELVYDYGVDSHNNRTCRRCESVLQSRKKLARSEEATDGIG